MAKTFKFRELVKALKEHDERFEFSVVQGKGSHRMIYHPDIDGEAKSFPVTCHGENTDMGTGLLASLRRRFNLPDDFLSTNKKAKKAAKKKQRPKQP